MNAPPSPHRRRLRQLSINKDKASSEYSLRSAIPILVFAVGLFFWMAIYQELYYITPKSHLILGCAPIGLVVALIVFWILYKKPGEKLPIGDRIFGFTGLAIGFTLGLTCIAVNVNDTYASGVTHELRRPIIAKWKGSPRDGRWSISCRVDQKTVEFQIPLNLWHSLDEGDIVLLRIRNGMLGSKFVDDIIPVESNSSQ